MLYEMSSDGSCTRMIEIFPDTTVFCISAETLSVESLFHGEIDGDPETSGPRVFLLPTSKDDFERLWNRYSDPEILT